MLKFGNKEFRNLQEQVEKNMKDILFILQEEGVLNEFGIKVVGQEDTAASMPTVSDYKENNPDWAYGDAYAIGTEAPYTLYILTRANGTHPNDYWFNIGSFPVTGPQGPQGPQGEVGPQGQTGNPGTNGLDAGFGTISATAETVSSTDPATVTITTSGPNTAKNISFAFEIPQGEKGKDGVSEWGHIDGSIDNQTDLVNALQAKQNASNAVTTDGTQTITGQKTFSNGVYIGPQMSIDSLANSTILDIKRKGATEYRFATGAFLPNINNNYSLGTSVYKWKDLYLSGNLTDGTNSISVADIASKSEYATKKDFDDLKSIVYGIHSLTYNSYEFPYLTTSIIPDEVDGRKVVGGSYAIMDWVGGNSIVSDGEIKSTIITKIESWGYNLFDGELEIGAIDRTTGQDIANANSLRSKNYIPVVAGKTYTLETNLLASQFTEGYILEYDKDKNYVGYQVFNRPVSGTANQKTLSSDTRFVRLRYYGTTNLGGVIPANETCFHRTGSRTGYAPYVGKLGEINIPNAPLKLDGVNDIHNTLTFEEQSDGTYNAILTRNILVLDLGTINWGTPNSNGWVQTTDKINAKPSESSSTMPNAICDKYIVGTPNKAYTTDGYISINTSSYVTARDSSFIGKTKDEMKTIMSGVYLLVERATPTSEVIATGLTFDDTTFKIEKGGTIKAIYEEVPPIASIDFMTKGE